jgi:hypothetical protein
MHEVAKFFHPLKRYRIEATSGALLLLVCLLVLAPAVIDVKSPLTTSIYNVFLALVTNVFAALVWYSMLLAHDNMAKTEPLLKIFPFLADKSERIEIVLTSLPTSVGSELTGVGEAKALGILFDNFSRLNFPTKNITVRFSIEYGVGDVDRLLESSNVIVLGGPNYNQLAAALIEKFHNQLDYVFDEDVIPPQGTKKCSGRIIANRPGGKDDIVACPTPVNVNNDLEVTQDCGIIARVRNRKGRYVFLLAGGMTTGVWVAARMLTDDHFIDGWCGVRAPPHMRRFDAQTDFELVFECPVERLSVDLEGVQPLRCHILSPKDVSRT